MSEEYTRNESKLPEIAPQILAPFDVSIHDPPCVATFVHQGNRIPWEFYDSKLKKSEPGWKSTAILDFWHAAADTSGAVWFGMNAPTDPDVRDAIVGVGRRYVRDISLLMTVNILNSRMTAAVSVPTKPKWATEEAAYRIIDKLPATWPWESL